MGPQESVDRLNARHAQLSHLMPWEKVTPGRRHTSHVLRSRAVNELVKASEGASAAQSLSRELRLDQEDRTDAAVVIQETLPDGYVARWVLAALVDQEAVGVTDYAVRSLTVEPKGRKTPEGGLNAKRLRQLSPARIRAAAVEAAVGDAPYRPANEREAQSATALLAALKRMDQDDALARVQPDEQRKGGRPRISEGILARVAIAYLEEQGKGPGVLRRIGRRPEIDRPENTVRDWVRKARQEGFLAAAEKQGRRGAAPGPRLLEMQQDLERNQP